MTTVANCFNIQQAEQIRMRLESAGIPAFIPDETSAGVVPHHFMTPSGVRVQVADEQADEARKLIAEDEAGSERF